MTEPPIVTPPGWKRWCPHCRADVVAYRDHDLTCMFCDGVTWATRDNMCGSSTGYNHGCRCPDCCQAHRNRMARYRRKIRSRFVPARVHGTTNGYQNYGCRCVPCRAAAAEAERRAQRTKA